jgi:hypothetical protein
MNSPLHNIGWGVNHNGLESLLFDMGDMHKLSPNILKIMEFQKGLTIKENLEFLLSAKTWDRLVQFVPLKQMRINIIFLHLHDERKGHKGELMFWEQGIIRLY